MGTLWMVLHFDQCEKCECGLNYILIQACIFEPRKMVLVQEVFTSAGIIIVFSPAYLRFDLDYGHQKNEERGKNTHTLQIICLLRIRISRVFTLVCLRIHLEKNSKLFGLFGAYTF